MLSCMILRKSTMWSMAWLSIKRGLLHTYAIFLVGGDRIITLTSNVLSFD
jgi:hypothetical protein